MDDNLVEVGEYNLISQYASIKNLENVRFKEFCTICKGVLIEANFNQRSDNIENNDAETNVTISIGNMCYVDSNSTITPPIVGYQMTIKNSIKKRVPICSQMKLGSYICIGKCSRINCSEIGSYVLIENNVELGRSCRIGDCVIIRNDSKIPNKAIIPSYSYVTTSVKSSDCKNETTLEITPLPLGIKSQIMEQCKYAYLGMPIVIDNVL